MPCAMNAANEAAVAAFLASKIGFLEIYIVIEKTMQAHQVKVAPSLADLYAVDEWARALACDVMKKLRE